MPTAAIPTFASRLQGAGITAKQIQDKLGVPTSTAYAWLAGDRTPKPLTAREILRQLKVRSK